MEAVLTAVVVLFVIWIIRSITEFIKKNSKRKYEVFVQNHSIALKELLELNAKYSFNQCDNLGFEHTYDNEKFFNQIFCRDYLIYQLQFNRRKALEILSLIKQNKFNYDKYIDEMARISLGKYDAFGEDLSRDELLRIERRIYEKYVLRPNIHFNINVALYCSTINGNIYDEKSELFDEYEVQEILRRLNNKSGTFFNDREIWEAICRVERGRVSNKMRFSIYERDGYRCRICGATDAYTTLEIDHIIPIAKGGKSNYDNLQTLCSRCNAQKGDGIPGGRRSR